MTRRFALAAVLALMTAGAAAVSLARPAPAASSYVPFTRAAFERAQAEDRRIVVDVYAAWCSTCQAQESVLERMTARADNADLIVFHVDFDTQKDEVRRFRAPRQSTLIAYRGTRMTGILVADTRESEIAALIDTTR
jgi:thioredoxin 1